MEITKIQNYIKQNNGIQSLVGFVEIINFTPLGQGGNAIVYKGKIGECEVAIKFLLKEDDSKIQRFIAEYINTAYYFDKLSNVINYIHYDEVEIDKKKIPYIIMKAYSKNLNSYRNSLNEKIEWDEVTRLFNSLCKSINSLELSGIIHRDLKPENVLLDENGEYYIADFGIAHFLDDAVIKGLTKKGDRLANINFSAPEQFIKNGKISFATDLYAFGQIIYWFIFGETVRGVGVKKLSEIYDDKKAEIIDEILAGCLQNDMIMRPQSVEDILDFIEKSEQVKKVNIYEDMYTLKDVICSVIPDCYNQIYYCDNQDEIKKIINKISLTQFNDNLWFNTKSGNSDISKFENIENKKYILDYQLINIKGIWLYQDSSLHNNIFLIETDEIESFVIDGYEYKHVIQINNDEIKPYGEHESGYVKYKGIVYKTSELKIDEILINNTDKYIALGTKHQCCIIPNNDIYIEKLQSIEFLNADIVREYWENTRRNLSRNVIEMM